MTITRIELIKADFDYHEAFRIAIMESTGTQNLFVRVYGDTGDYGLGEASPTEVITGDTQGSMFEAGIVIARLLIGRDPMQIDSITDLMSSQLIGNTTVRSAFDVALYDLIGKTLHLPLYALLGGTRRSFQTDNTVGIDHPATMAEKAGVFQKEGYSAIKVKLGTTFEEDVERIHAIRKAVGDMIPLRIDANQGWDEATAIRVLGGLDGLGIEYCEQPVAHWNLAGMRAVRESTSIPIMADESVFDHHDAFRLASGRCCQFLNIKLAKSAGIHTALKINSVAESNGMACMVGCMSETRIGLSAAAHLVSARPNIRYADLDSHFDHTIDPVVGGVEISAAGVEIPDTPGHGADLDPVFAERCPSTIIE